MYGTVTNGIKSAVLRIIDGQWRYSIQYRKGRDTGTLGPVDDISEQKAIQIVRQRWAINVEDKIDVRK